MRFTVSDRQTITCKKSQHYHYQCRIPCIIGHFIGSVEANAANIMHAEYYWVCVNSKVCCKHSLQLHVFQNSKKKKTLTPNFSVHCASVLSLNHSTFRLERILPFDSLTVVDATRHLRPAMPWVEVRLTADILPSSLRGLTNISFSGNPERATPKGKMWVSRPPQSNGISWANHGPPRLLFESHLVI